MRQQIVLLFCPLDDMVSGTVDGSGTLLPEFLLKKLAQLDQRFLSSPIVFTCGNTYKETFSLRSSTMDDGKLFEIKTQNLESLASFFQLQSIPATYVQI